MLGCRDNSMCGGVLITALPPPYCGAHILFSCSTVAYMGIGAILISSNAGMLANEYKEYMDKVILASYSSFPFLYALHDLSSFAASRTAMPARAVRLTSGGLCSQL